MNFDELIEYRHALLGASHEGPWEGNVGAYENCTPGEATP
jgi:hypothetical protein